MRFFHSHLSASIISVAFFNRIVLSLSSIPFKSMRAKQKKTIYRTIQSDVSALTMIYLLEKKKKTDEVHIWPAAIWYFNFLLSINCNALQWLNHIHANTNLFRIWMKPAKNDNDCIKCRMSNGLTTDVKFCNFPFKRTKIAWATNRKYLPSSQWIIVDIKCNKNVHK